MTATTQQVRDWWAPPCDSASFVTIAFGGNGAHITVDPRTVDIWLAVEAIFAKHGYEIRKDDTGAYVCRKITGGTGTSLHADGIAVDVNWLTNPYGPVLVTDIPPGAIRDIEALEVDGQQLIRWGGRYSGNKDGMHFEVVVPPSVAEKFVYIAEGDWLMGANAEDVIKAINEAKASNIRQHQKDRRHDSALAKAQARADKKLSDHEIDAILKAAETGED